MSRSRLLIAVATATLTLVSCAEKQSGTGAAASAAPVGAVSAAHGVQTLEAGCAGCVFAMPGAEGCQLAVKIDGKTYLVSGVEMPGHETGLCDRSRTAEVAGRLEGDRFVAASFALKP